MKERTWTVLILLALVPLPLVPLLGAQKEAQDRADSKQQAAREVPGKDVFGLTKVWQFHIELTTKVYTDPRLLPLAAAIEATSSVVTKVVTPSGSQRHFVALPGTDDQSEGMASDVA